MIYFSKPQLLLANTNEDCTISRKALRDVEDASLCGILYLRDFEKFMFIEFEKKKDVELWISKVEKLYFQVI